MRGLIDSVTIWEWGELCELTGSQEVKEKGKMHEWFLFGLVFWGEVIRAIFVYLLASRTECSSATPEYGNP